MSTLFGSGRKRADKQDVEHWMSTSDLMAGLMMVFLFIAIALMRAALAERDKIKEVAIAYQQNQVAIYNALMTEFEDDLSRWNAEVDQETLSFRFKSPEIFFDVGEITLKPEFETILTDFFPRYLDALEQFHDSIDEVRIEGHTSSDWNTSTSKTEAYFKNMALSQGRTRSVLSYVYELPQTSNQREWVRANVAAVGFSSSRRIIDEKSGLEDRERSRRVAFRVITNADIQIRRILEVND